MNPFNIITEYLQYFFLFLYRPKEIKHCTDVKINQSCENNIRKKE